MDVIDPILALRPFVPARDYDLSRRFYEALGFVPTHRNDDGTILKLGSRGPSVVALRQRLLRSGDLDQSAGDSPAFDSYVEAGVRRFQARHGMMPVNHMVTIRAGVAARPGVAASLIERFRAAGNPYPMGRAALAPAIALALRYAARQGLLQRPLDPAEIWTGLPADCT